MGWRNSNRQRPNPAIRVFRAATLASALAVPALPAAAAAPVPPPATPAAAATVPQPAQSRVPIPKPRPTPPGTDESAPIAPAEPAGAPPAPPEPDSAATQTPAPPAPAPPAPAPPDGRTRVLFEAGSINLTDAARSELDVMAAYLKSEAGVRIQIRAYAAGTRETALEARRLSLSRALKVRSHLIDQGIVSTRMDVRALGSKARDKPFDRVDAVIVGR